MKTIRDFVIKACRKLYCKASGKKFESPLCDMDRQSSNDKIYNLLTSSKPCMIARFGTTESAILCNYLGVYSKAGLFKRCWNYISNNEGLPWWDPILLQVMRKHSGIFPESEAILKKFSERYLQDIPEIDLLGSFNATEVQMPLRSDVINIHLECMYPFFVESPWTRALKGKKVLVIHPFVSTIWKQHQRHELLFSNNDVYPDYELIGLRAVQSIADAEVPFNDWFEALKWMEDEIAKIDFDVAIIGCGAYGLPLAAHVKRLGKKAVHLGGGSQLLFGIKGKRWDNNGYHWKEHPELDTNYSRLYNEFWTRPNAEETPANAKKVEGACYW